MLGNLIGGFIVILVGVTLIPTVADEINIAQHCNTSTTGNFNCVNNATFTSSSISGTSTSTILGLSTLFFALGVMSAGIAVTAQGLRAAGMLGM